MFVRRYSELDTLLLLSNILLLISIPFYFISSFPDTGLYFSLNGTIYLPGATILITDVGDSYPSGSDTNQVDPGPSLVCVTSNVNTMCCRGSDNPGSGGMGNWLFPDGAIVLGNSANGDITRSSHTQQIRLNRKRTDVISPTGVYTCEVPDGSNTSLIHKATITLSKYDNFYNKTL